MKYIIIKASWNQEEEAIIFPDSLIHKEIARSIPCMDDYELVSAGFCNSNLEAYGESTSLHRKSRKEDTAILQMNFYEIKTI